MFSNPRTTYKPIKKKAAKQDEKNNNNSISGTKQHDRPSKRRKVTINTANATASTSPTRITCLPLEILAEIFSYISSPRTVLALARSSKFFCATFTSPTADFIWRGVRARCASSPIPDPTPNFTEAAYAAFIFDAGVCDICGTETKEMFHSFALRVRLCNNASCAKKWRSEHIVREKESAEVSGWILSAEAKSVLDGPSYHQTYWPEGMMDRVHLKSHRTKALSKLRALQNMGLSDQDKVKKLVASRIETVMKHAVQLYKWKIKYLMKYYAVKSANETSGKKLASTHGWELWDVYSTQTWISLVHRRLSQLEPITQEDIIKQQPSIEAEVKHILENRKRSREEQLLTSRREQVKIFYEWLHSTQPQNQLPTLKVFRAFHVPQLVQGGCFDKGSPEEVRAILQNKTSVAYVLTETALAEWRVNTRREFAILLKVGPFRDKSGASLHPVERLDARFKCKRCDKVKRRFNLDECLTFSGACLHECPGLKKKQRDRYIWSPQQFVADTIAISVIRKALELCGIDPKLTGSHEAVKQVGARFKCNSCNSNIVMDFQQLIGHSHRHPSAASVSLLSQEDADVILQRPLELGLVEKLMDSSPSVKEQLSAQVYGCRHCSQDPSRIRRADGPSRTIPKVAATEAPTDAGTGSNNGGARATVEDRDSARLDSTKSSTTAAEESADVLVGDGPCVPRAPDERSQAASDSAANADMAGAVPKTLPEPSTGAVPARLFIEGSQKLRTFNGLVSHVKAKHGVVNIRDEDLFRTVL